MANPISILGSTTIDQSGTITPLILTAGSTITVQRDAGTPAGDPVVVTLSGASVLAASTVLVQGGATINVGGLAGVSAASRLSIGTTGTLAVLPSLGTNIGNQINFTGSNGVLVLDQSAPNLALAGSVSDFSASDVIDFRGVAAATSATLLNGVITLLNGTTSVATLTVSGSASNTTLGILADGAGGYDVGDNLTGVTSRMSGLASDYTIAVSSTTEDYLSDLVPARDGVSVPQQGSTLGFANGIGFMDPAGNAEQVARLYQAILGRAADIGGLTYFANAVTSQSQTIANVADSLLNSQEFHSKFGTLSNSQLVNQLYQNLGQPQDANAASTLSSLNSGLDKGQVMSVFANQSAAVQSTISYVGSSAESAIYRLYDTALGRTPDAAGLASFVNAAASGVSLATLAQDFTASPEFAAKTAGMSASGMVSQLYQNTFGRAPDAGGLTYWTGQLTSNGAASVVGNIASSLEARIDTAAATHDGWVFLGQSG